MRACMCGSTKAAPKFFEQHSVMWDDKEFDQAFQKRDSLKNEKGLSFCLSEFELLFQTNHMHLPHVLNYGICLLETENYKEAEYILGELCKPETAQNISENWLFESLKFYTLAIKERSRLVATKAALERLRHFNRHNRGRVISHIIIHLTDHNNFANLVVSIEELENDFDLSDAALRKFYEIASSKNELTEFEKICGSRSSSHDNELKLISLLHGDFSAPASLDIRSRWRDVYAGLEKSRSKLSPFDAYRLSLQMHERLGPEMAEQEIQNLIALGEEYFACYWPLGALQEPLGDVAAASHSYSSAGRIEMLRENQPIENISPVDRSEVKISCIAISFNDAPLVETYCKMVRPHCDEIIVNDGGSTDGTIDLFHKFSKETGFPVHVIRDQQASFRDRNIFNKDGYRKAGLGGVKGFEADRRRTTTLLLAQHDYVLLADLDDYFPEFPNLKTLVSSNYGVDHIAGSKRELVDCDFYCDLYQNRQSALPTLFRRDRHHAFSGISGADEYLARLDHDMASWASKFMTTAISKAYHFWHLKWLLDPSQKTAAEPSLGVKSSVYGIKQRPDIKKILSDIAVAKH